MHARFPGRRLALLSLLGALVGLVAGGAAWLLVHLIAILTNAALFSRWGTTLPSMTELDRGPRVVIVAAVGGALVSLIARWAPIIRGHGIPEAMEAVLVRHSRVAPRTAVAKPLSAAIAIGTGGPFGAEGPIIVTGGALGSLVGQVIPVSASERKILLASGAAAGMAATFGSPLAAVVLAIELLLFEFSTRALVPLVVAAAVAGAVHSLVFENGPLFAVPAQEFPGLGQLPLYAVLGCACGLLAVGIIRSLSLVERGYERLPVSPAWHPVIGGAGFALVGLAVPRALGVGYDAIGDVLAGRLALGALAALATAKLVTWLLALASGTSGGTLAPILLISGAGGALAGQLLVDHTPLDVSPAAFALAAMAATFGSASGATFASVVFVFELTRDYDAVVPLMVATVLATLVVRSLSAVTLMSEKLARRGLVVPSDYHADVLASRRVEQVMTRDVQTLPTTATVGDAVAGFAAGGHSAYPVVDGDGRVVGVVSRGDLVGGEEPEESTLGELLSGPVAHVGPADTVLAALEQMLEAEVDHLPVVDRHRLVGVCTRTDVLRARRDALALERLVGR
jgi:H+/Cl- antiporter ClcA/predicted transcriptional regulator